VKPTVATTYFVNKQAIARVQAKLRAKAKQAKAQKHDVRVGINQADGSKRIIKYTGEEGAPTLAYVALAHEFGAGVPMRSWFRTWFDANAERNRRQMAAAMREEARGNTQAVPLLAIRWASEMRLRITSDDAGLRPLADSTQRQRKRAGLAEGPPLFAIGQIVEAIRAMVDDKVVGP
jgi:hypothetical protein